MRIAGRARIGECGHHSGDGGRVGWLTDAATAVAVPTVGTAAAQRAAKAIPNLRDSAANAVAVGTVNTDAAFAALNRAFLISNGNQRYY